MIFTSARSIWPFKTTGYEKARLPLNTTRLARILNPLDVATTQDDMNIPGLRFHSLSGDQKDRYAVDASGNWRITFGWDGEDAIDIDLEDYH